MHVYLVRSKCQVFLLIIFLIATNLKIFAGEKSVNSYSTSPWSVRMLESEIKRHPNVYGYWGYVTGTFLKSAEQLWRKTNNSVYYNYIKSSVDASITSTGTILFYTFKNFSLDDINEGRILLLMYNETKNQKYKVTADTLRKQLKYQPRTVEGGFWHRNNISAGTYPHQMWLDGIYMANPFYAEYGKLFNEPSDYDDVVTQFTVMEKHARDELTGLLYHGWDESKTQAWANALTGCSPSFWGRAIGWYSMALVDVLDYLPEDYSKRSDLIEILKRLSSALKKFQHPVRGTWFQVVDKYNEAGNWAESSASCMFVYTLAKAIRMKYIDADYWEVVKKGYKGILNEFITTNSDSTINLVKTCSVAGLGGNPYRDGSYDYYVNQTTVSTNDGKGVSPFILASLEMERTNYIVPPLYAALKMNQNNSVTISWDDKSFNAKGFVIERKKDGENVFEEISRVKKGITTYTDSNLRNLEKISYRLCAYNDSSRSDYSDEIYLNGTSIFGNKEADVQFKLTQNYPNPFNPETTINYTLKSASHVSIKVYDALGREIAILVNEFQPAGNHSALFVLNSTFSSGIYFYTLSTGIYSETKKMILLR